MLDFDNMNSDALLKRYDIVAESKEKPETIAEKHLPKDPLLRKVAEDVLYMKYKTIEESVTAALKENTPEDVIEKGLLKGMDAVSDLYGRGIYYLPHVMVSADAMDRGIKLAEKALGSERKTKGDIVMHAAEGDPHDIGKNIAAVLLKSNGYNIIDMGKDVAVDDVVKTVVDVKPLAVTGTALMTTTMSAFPRVAEKLKENGMDLPFICAGGAVNREYVESFPMGIYAQKAANGPGLVGKALDGWDWKKIRDKWDEILASSE
ncbi:MAG TPA: B12-binding domain-containing protein [Methanomassiliicoccaceae archaeon]|jgi:methanol corrinoid protein|nr:B12-binding domain-containing protein [Methanomassiliicoccaceae archaeon]